MRRGAHTIGTYRKDGVVLSGHTTPEHREPGDDGERVETVSEEHGLRVAESVGEESVRGKGQGQAKIEHVELLHCATIRRGHGRDVGRESHSLEAKHWV